MLIRSIFSSLKNIVYSLKDKSVVLVLHVFIMLPTNALYFNLSNLFSFGKLLKSLSFIQRKGEKAKENKSYKTIYSVMYQLFLHAFTTKRIEENGFLLDTLQVKRDAFSQYFLSQNVLLTFLNAVLIILATSMNAIKVDRWKILKLCRGTAKSGNEYVFSLDIRTK